MSRWQSGTVVGNRRWTEGLHSLRIEAPVDPFVAGKLSRLALDIDGERVARPYSYVNAPTSQFWSSISIGCRAAGCRID